MKTLEIWDGAAPERERKRVSGSSTFLSFLSFNGATDSGWCEFSMLVRFFLSFLTTFKSPNHSQTVALITSIGLNSF